MKSVGWRHLEVCCLNHQASLNASRKEFAGIWLSQGGSLESLSSLYLCVSAYHDLLFFCNVMLTHLAVSKHIKINNIEDDNGDSSGEHRDEITESRIQAPYP